MRADGNNQRNLTRDLALDWAPSWSPRGNRIAFGSTRNWNHEVYVMDLDGGNVRNLTRHAESDDGPDWSRAALAVSTASKQFTTWGWLKSEDHDVLPAIANPATKD